LQPEGVLPKLAISTDLFQKVGVFFPTTKRPSITTFLPATDHVFAPKNHENYPFFAELPPKTPQEKCLVLLGMIDPTLGKRYTH
jgi:hypothetical protein